MIIPVDTPDSPPVTGSPPGADSALAAEHIRQSGRGSPLALSGVVRRFDQGAVQVLDGIDLSVPAGQFLALLGPSGCGKSTLLRLVAALDGADAGRVRIAGQTIAKHRHPAADAIAFVFQQAQLLPWRTLLRNVELPLELAGVGKAERRERALELIAEVGLQDARERYPAELSGGTKMRASLARALITEPSLLLLDEPFAALDEITRERLDMRLYQLHLDHDQRPLLRLVP